MKSQALYGVEYTLLEPLPARLVENEPILIGLQLRNTGLTPWLATGYPVMLVVRWKTLNGIVVQELPWQPLPRPVPCGDAVTVELRVTAPAAAGEYILAIELVEHRIAWFHERGVAPLCIPVTVEPPRGPRITIINGNCVANDAVGTHIAAQVQALAEAGFQPLLLTSFVDERLPRALRRFMVVVRPEEITNPNEYSRPFAEHFRRSSAVIVNYSTYYDLVELIRIAPAPVLFDYHGVTPPQIWGVGQPGYEDVARGVANVHLVQFADYAVAHSQYMVNELVATGLIAPSRVNIHPYAVVKGSGYAAPPDPQLQQQYNLADKRVLLYVGRMARNKRIHILVEALPLIRTRYPETVLLLVGETGHAYAGYVEEVKARAVELGVADAVIFTGKLDRDIADIYRLCDVFVTASIHEGFCMPIVEAMAFGKPVVATAATAIPDTLQNAGLLFTPDNPVHLAQTVVQVFETQACDLSAQVRDSKQAIQSLRERPIAFVTPRYGRNILGGAERGAQEWAEQLVKHGLMVEVLTTNMVDLVRWQTGELPAEECINGVKVRRFAVDPVDPVPFHEVQAKASAGLPMTRQDEERFMRHNLHSRQLEEYIACHREEYSAFIFTPYLFGTSYYAAQQAGDRAFHIPCLHDEPAAQFSLFREMLEEARGIFFNSPAEERLAREKLRLANPYATVLGYGFPDQPLVGDPERFRQRTGLQAPFLLYSGRLEAAKNVPLLIEWFLAYKEQHPASNLTLAFAGVGDVALPNRADIVSLGMIVDRQALADAYAACLALCQLSLNESFSIVMMEAWQQGRPVIVHTDCTVTSDHVRNSGGGYICANAAEFSAAVADLLAKPDLAQELGERGRSYVQSNFVWSVLVDRMLVALASFLQPRPLTAELAQRGIRRALDFTPERFKSSFIELVSQLIDEDWRVVDQIQQQLASLAVHSSTSSAGIEQNHPRNTKPIQRIMNTLGQLSANDRSNASARTMPQQMVEPDTIVQLMTSIIQLLRQSQREQRRLAREMALLADQLAARHHGKNNAARDE